MCAAPASWCSQLVLAGAYLAHGSRAGLVRAVVEHATVELQKDLLRALRPVRLQGIGRVPTWVLRRVGDEPAARRGSKPLRKRR